MERMVMGKVETQNKMCKNVQESDCQNYYELFFLGNSFIHRVISKKSPTFSHRGNYFEFLENGSLLLNNNIWTGDYYKGYMAFPNGALDIIYTNIPKVDFILSSNVKSAIVFKTTSIGYFSWVKKDLFVRLYENDGILLVNGKRVKKYEGKFNIGDSFIIDGVLIERRKYQLKIIGILQPVHLNPMFIFAQAYQSEYPVDFPNYRRSPRIYLRAPEDKIQLNAPKARKEKRKGEILRTIIPPLGMIAITGAVSTISRGNPLMMMSMGGVSMLTAGFSVSSYLTTRKETDIENRTIEENYQNHLLEVESKLKRLSNEQLKTLEYNYPSIEKLVEMAQDFSPRIYEKMPVHEDFLNVRLGEGEIETSFSVDFADREQTDEWEQFAKKSIYEKYSNLGNAPIIVSLKNQTLGLAGNHQDLHTASQSILFQIAMMHSYHDVEFVSLISDEDYQNIWSEWRWLPHFRLKSLNLRGIIHNEQTRDMVLNSFYQMIMRRKQILNESRNKADAPNFSPHFILTILDDTYLAGHGLNEFLVEDMTQYGVTVIWAKETISMLPETVTALIDYKNNEVATLINDEKEFVNKLFTPNKLLNKIDSSIQLLANLDHIEAEKNTIPDSISFLELYNVKTTEELDILSRWQIADTSKTLAVPLGVRGKDDIVYLNLHERAHGPHGLVAGTTGSGKSEILQSYILSLAVNFSPEDVGFLPIDFKGGGMANLFANLPHLLGSITNLDGASSARALKSIRAELQKRQREFGKYGVNHINGYTKLYKEGQRESDPVKKEYYPSKPLPHLFLISDEFAELKANEPEFMAELVSTARIGRSLGVHLILATQKPSGVVDDQIWSNSRFKLALKVADESDSKEIIKTPDAASIIQPGRAYLQVGNNEIYELFQSAWSGAQYEPNKTDEEKIDERIWLVNSLGQFELLSSDLSSDDDYTLSSDEEKTELSAVIDMVDSSFKNSDLVKPDKPWLPPLAKEIVAPSQDWLANWSDEKNLSVPIGVLDIPEKQQQVPFDFNIENYSHFAIYGSAGFGKSIALQTFVMSLARMNSPEQINFYLFDFGTNGLLPLRDLPHVADIVTLQEEEKLLKFLKRIRTDIQERKDLFSELGVASISQYESKTGKDLPIISVVLDAFDAIQESPIVEEIESVIGLVLREGASIGIYMSMTALRANTFRLAINSNLPTRLALFLVEDNAIRELVGREALIPQPIVGRGQVKQDDGVHEFQFYLPSSGSNDIERLASLEEEIINMSGSWHGDVPKSVPMLPKIVELSDFFKNKTVTAMLERLEIPLAYDKDTTEVVGFIPQRHGYFLIAEDTAQQSEFLTQTILEDFSHLRGKATRVIFDAGGRFQGREEAYDVLISEDEYASFLTEVSTEIDDRELNDYSDPMFIYIPDAHLLNNHILTSFDLFKKLLAKGPKNHIYIILQGIQRSIESGFDDFNKQMRANIPAGIFGTRVSDQSLVNVKLRIGEAIVPLDEAYYFEVREIKGIKLNQ